MRNIIADLRERLDLIAEEQSKLEARMEELRRHRQALEATLAAESHIWDPAPSAQRSTQPKAEAIGGSLSRVLLGWLSDGQVHSTGEFFQRIAAEKPPGIVIESARAVHAGLLSMARSGRIDSLGDGRWRIKSEGQATDTPPSPVVAVG
jgi:hypothetical protein